MSLFQPIDPRGPFAAAHAANVGTILGHHTLAEVSELLKAKDYEIAQIQAKIDKNVPQIAAADPALHDDWLSFRDRYDATVAPARSLVESAGAAGLAVPAEDVWQGLISFLTPNPYGSQDFQGLYVRLVRALGTGVDFSNMPRPLAADVDLGIYQGADDLTIAVEDAAKAVADAVARAAAAAKKAAGDNALPIALIAALAIGAGVVLIGLRR